MKKTNSQNNWIRRQNKDYFFNLSKKEGYRSRAAYKLIEIHKKYNIIKSNSKVIDLGASPGGWTQVVSSVLKNNTQKIVAIDKKKMDPVPKCKFFLDEIENFLLNNNSLRDKTSGQEQTDDDLDILSNGFKCRRNFANNQGDVLFFAWADSPVKYSNAR